MKPGDFVSYYAKATDNNGAEGNKTTTSDIYFVNVKPFKKDYKAAQSQAGGGGGGGGEVGQLSEQQRQIVAATFNVVRDKDKLKADKFRENVVFLNLAQAKLRAQVDELVGKLQARVGVVDPGFKAIADALPKASAEMKTAEGNLKAQQAKEALTPEQRALKLLQDAEQNYEMQVRQGGGGGGGGGAQDQLSEDLADLFELELDKLSNQYEMQKRAEQQGNDRQVDELAEKLKELARRQQQELERQRRASASQQQQGGGGGGASQRQLADELEQEARRLEQLTREQQRPELAEAARQMRQAADAMRQAAANGAKDGGAQAAAALNKLREAQSKLERNQGDRAQRDIQSARRQAEELANDQKDIASEVGAMGPGQPNQQGKAKALSDRKEAMDKKVGELQKDLEALANDTRRDQKDASRKLDEAAGSIRDKRVREKIRYSKSQLGGSPSDYAKAMEDDISANLDALQRKIGEAEGALGSQTKKEALGRAADKASDLVRGLQSFGERMRQQQQQQARNGQSSQGQQNGKQQGSRIHRASKVNRVSRARARSRANKVSKAKDSRPNRDRVSKASRVRDKVSRDRVSRVRVSRVRTGKADRASRVNRPSKAAPTGATSPDRVEAGHVPATRRRRPGSARSTRARRRASSATGRVMPTSCGAICRALASTRATSTRS